MRRMAIVAAALLGLGFIGQASASAGLFHSDEGVGPRFHPLSSLGLSSFRSSYRSSTGIISGGTISGPYLDPHRSPRDFWMLR